MNASYPYTFLKHRILPSKLSVHLLPYDEKQEDRKLREQLTSELELT